MNKPVLLALIVMLLLVAASLYGSVKDITNQLYGQESCVERMEDIIL